MAAAARRRRRRHRRLAAAIVTLVVVAGVGTYIPVTLLAPAAAAAVAVSEPDLTQPAAATLVLPDVGASAVSVMGADEFLGSEGAGGILASSGGTDPRPIASITKLVTALVVLDAKPLGPTDAGPTISFSKADADLYDKYYVMDATVQPMRAGSSMSERDALETMLVVSATNYAEAVSTWAFRSQANFLRAAKAWLGANGLTGTTIVEPTGIDPRNVSTPVDLIALGKLALANPVVAAIARIADPRRADARPSAEQQPPPRGRWRQWDQDRNPGGGRRLPAVLRRPPGRRGRADHGGRRGARWPEPRRGGCRGPKTPRRHHVGLPRGPACHQGRRARHLHDPVGDDATIVAGADASVLTWSDTPMTSTMETKKIATGTSGSKSVPRHFVAGTATVTVPLVLKGAIQGPDAWWRLTHPPR